MTLTAIQNSIGGFAASSFAAVKSSSLALGHYWTATASPAIKTFASKFAAWAGTGAGAGKLAFTASLLLFLLSKSPYFNPKPKVDKDNQQVPGIDDPNRGKRMLVEVAALTLCLAAGTLLWIGPAPAATLMTVF